MKVNYWYTWRAVTITAGIDVDGGVLKLKEAVDVPAGSVCWFERENDTVKLHYRAFDSRLDFAMLSDNPIPIAHEKFLSSRN